jgi:hypothetical protein
MVAELFIGWAVHCAQRIVKSSHKTWNLQL